MVAHRDVELRESYIKEWADKAGPAPVVADKKTGAVVRHPDTTKAHLAYRAKCIADPVWRRIFLAPPKTSGLLSDTGVDLSMSPDKVEVRPR